MKCPCCSGKNYSVCCEPILQQGNAPTALALMRSRYSAYCLHQIDYLIETTHPSKRRDHNFASTAQWAKENKWQKLEIVSVEHGKIKDQRGIVEFKAYFQDTKGKTHIHHERSTFWKEDGKWFYVSGIINPKPTAIVKKVSRNDPCPCGSGKKYKKCCG